MKQSFEIIPLPDDAVDVEISPLTGNLVFISDCIPAWAELPGNYRLLFTRSTATEELAAKVVDRFELDNERILYRDYNGSADEWLDMSDYFYLATESLSTLLEIKGIKGNYCVIEKIK